jgi:hypothetical protein
MNYSKGKTHKVRKLRRAAMIFKVRSTVYSRAERFREEGVGADNYRIVVTLKPGWSFDEFYHAPEKEFSSTAEMLRGISKTYVS